MLYGFVNTHDDLCQELRIISRIFIARELPNECFDRSGLKQVMHVCEDGGPHASHESSFGSRRSIRAVAISNASLKKGCPGGALERLERTYATEICVGVDSAESENCAVAKIARLRRWDGERTERRNLSGTEMFGDKRLGSRMIEDEMVQPGLCVRNDADQSAM
ncbi:MAG TPA: hypothetical protein VKA61_06695 [Sphingomicrobium sp.]|nr:hypothetical protein [Sphingomicrobium sp.]